jgi:carbonic anhydrase
VNLSIFKNLRYDFPASIAVFFVAVPLCLGIAHASGAPLLSGLISGAIGGLIVGTLSKSSLSVSGPAAGLTAIAISGIQEIGSYEAFLLAIVLAGIFQIIFGLVKAGSISKYFPNCVIHGMLAAIGLILIFKQLPHLFGYDIEAMGVEEFQLTNQDIMDTAFTPETNTFTTMMHSISHVTPIISIIGILSLIIIFAWEYYLSSRFKSLPSSVIVVIFSTLFALIYNYFYPNLLSANHFVNIPQIDGLGSFLEQTSSPDWSFINNMQIYTLALTIALVASLETLLSIEAIDKLDPHKHITPTSRELIAQGIGNSISGLLGGLPITSVIVRSSVNLSAGAKTKLSTILHGILLLIGIFFLSTYLNYMPLTGLAAVLIFTGYKLAAPYKFIGQYQQGWDQFIPSVITTISILLTDLLVGVAIGLAVSFLFIVIKNYNAPAFVVADYGIKKRITLGESINFLHKYKIMSLLNSIPENSSLEIDASKTLFIDHDIEELIRDFRHTATEKNIELVYGGMIRTNQNRRKVMEANKEAYDRLIRNNKEWVQEKLKLDPNYFENLSKGQAPQYLFIGCSDSRVPAEDITKCSPGEMFVHRNVANMVVNADMNIMSVLQYSVEVLNVKHIILCGHYGCGGVKAAMDDKDLGLIDKWLMNIKDIYRLHKVELDSISDSELKYRRLVELNAQEQAYNLLKVPFIQKNRSLYGTPEIHAWAYDLQTGYINDLKLDPNTLEEYESIYKMY